MSNTAVAERSQERLSAYVGQELAVSEWETVGQQRVNNFAECTGDHQWIHVDPERAQHESPFGNTIAHGYLLLSLVAPAALKAFAGPFGTAATLNYGLDRVRFVSPVRVGSRVRLRTKLLSADDKGSGRVLLSTENTLEIEGSEKPAMVAQALFMLVG